MVEIFIELVLRMILHTMFHTHREPIESHVNPHLTLLKCSHTQITGIEGPLQLLLGCMRPR